MLNWPKFYRNNYLIQLNKLKELKELTKYLYREHMASSALDGP